MNLATIWEWIMTLSIIMDEAIDLTKLVGDHALILEASWTMTRY